MNYENMFQKAMELQNNGALNEALDIYQKLLTITPYNSDIWNLMGCIAQSRCDDKKAIDCFLSAIKYSPKPFGIYYFNLALSYKALSKKADALEAMTKASDLMGDIKEVWNYRGVLEAQTGDVSGAMKSFCKSLEIDGNYKEARANLCFYTNDIVRLKKIADEDDNDFMANFLMGQKVENLEEKEKYFFRAYNLRSDRSDLINLIAGVKRAKGCKSDALIWYHKALVFDENNVEALLGVADLNLELKEYKKAEIYYLKSFNEGVNSVGAYLNYGALLFETKRYNEALEFYRKAINKESDNPDVCYNLALILKEVGDYEEALGLMFNAHLKQINRDEFVIGIMETLVELYEKNPELALKIALNWQKSDENNVFSKRILKGMTFGIDEDDLEYTKRLFNAFSKSYDETIKKLESNIINKFMELNPKLKGKILDLGCGTGLAGYLLKNKEVELYGVDLSENMIDEAQKKSVYKELYCQDIKSFLDEKDIGEFDVVTMFDVVSYMGDLRDILCRLKGKEVWFSIEKAQDNINKDYYLTPNGRYKHKLSYIEGLKNEYNFFKIKEFEIVLRNEADVPVLGYLIMLK
ncbi:MAG: tetratricopeptide repeat protein [Alphaproteobacteria bacterium]|nr:tetratricopeptide repeat protein [Alphaproteobacteria bacterium]